MEDFEREVKVLVVGNGGVGKTSMITRFCSGAFSDDPRRTVGVDFLERLLPVPALGREARMLCWDTAGQEDFDALTRAYYRGAGAAVLMFSTTDRASFDAVPGWCGRVRAECGDVAVALVQNKVDLLDRAAVSSEEAEGMARRLGVKFYRSCVKEGLNVTEVFLYLAELHDRKLAAGHLAEGSAAQGLEQPGTAAATAGGGGGGPAWGGGGVGEEGEGVDGGGALAIVSAEAARGDLARGGKSFGGGLGAMPTAVELGPAGSKKKPSKAAKCAS